MLRVIEPGLVLANGVWMDEDAGVIINDRGITVFNRDNPQPFTFAGACRDTILDWRGPIDAGLFDFMVRS